MKQLVTRTTLVLLLVGTLVQNTLAYSIPPTPFGRDLYFDGNSSYVSVPGFGNIIPTNEVTVEFWAYANALGGQSAFMLEPDVAVNRFQAHISYSNGNTYWDFGDIGIDGRISVANPPDAVGTWTHYALVASQSGNYMKIYTNGNLLASQSWMAPFVRGNYELRLGGNPTAGFPLNGELDDFRVWNTARSQSEIQASYGAPLNGDEPGLLVYYRFNETTGNVATNSATATGAAYNGTLVNSPLRVTSYIRAKIVLNLNDSGAQSLRSTLASAVNGDTILFEQHLSGGTIALTSGELVVDKQLTIDATALPAGIKLDGNDTTRIFNIAGSGQAALKALSLMYGYVQGSFPANTGAAVWNDGTLRLEQCTVAYNHADGYGGGIENNGSLTVDRCTFNQNSSGGGGGAIDNNGSVSASQSTFYRNSITGGDGGAIWAGGTVNVNHCTLVENSSDNGATAGIAQYQSAAIFVTNSIIANNAPRDLSGTITQQGNLTNAAPGLAPFGNYGGLTETLPPLPGSLAVDTAITSTFTNDQRGLPRPLDGDANGTNTADLGAVELKITPPLAGSYNGLFYETTHVDSGRSGFFNASLNTARKFSARLQFADKSYSFSGKFDATGKASNSIPRRGLSPLTVRLYSMVTNQLFGFVSDGTWQAELDADRATFNSRKNPAPQAGNYTLSILGRNDAAKYPGGSGFGTFKVGADGNGILLTTLADGTPVAQTTPLSPDGQWPLFRSINSGKGSVLSWLNFNTNSPKNFYGSFFWARQTNANAKLYRAGFTNQTSLYGSQYLKPTNSVRILNYTNGEAVFGGDHFIVKFQTYTILANNKVTNGTDSTFTLKFDTATGRFSGKVTDPVTLKSINYQGAVDQLHDRGNGYYTTTNQSGYVHLRPQ